MFGHFICTIIITTKVIQYCVLTQKYIQSILTIKSIVQTKVLNKYECLAPSKTN